MGVCLVEPMEGFGLVVLGGRKLDGKGMMVLQGCSSLSSSFVFACAAPSLLGDLPPVFLLSPLIA